MAAPTKEEWSHIHAKAWQDPEFRAMLESDPAAALARYGKEVGKNFDRVIDIGPRPDGVADSDLYKHHKIPPACC